MCADSPDKILHISGTPKGLSKGKVILEVETKKNGGEVIIKDGATVLIDGSGKREWTLSKDFTLANVPKDLTVLGKKPSKKKDDVTIHFKYEHPTKKRLSTDAKEQMTVLKIDIGDYFRNVLPTEYWYFPTYSDPDKYLDRQWPTAIGAPKDKGTFKWEILGGKGFDAMGIKTADGIVSTVTKTDDPRIFMVTRGYSDATKDVTLKLTYSTPDGRCICSVEKQLTVRTFRLLLGQGASYAKFGTGGWSVKKTMKLVDHLDKQIIPHGVDFNEKFSNWQSSDMYPNENWAAPQESGDENAVAWRDLVEKPSLPGDTPSVWDFWLNATVPDYVDIAGDPPTNDRQAQEEVDRVNQAWRYGSATPGNGDLPLRGNVTLRRNRGYANHSN